MKVLVTGGAGFIGSHVVDGLIAAGHEVSVVDNLATGNRRNLNPKATLYDADVNILGSLNLFQQCLRTDVRKVLFISSDGACYGEPIALPCAEDHPIRPLSPYGASKAAVELYLFLYRATYGLDYTVLRYANVYGPRQDMLAEEGRVMAIFSQLMLQGRQPIIDGDGEQRRPARRRRVLPNLRPSPFTSIKATMAPD